MKRFLSTCLILLLIAVSAAYYFWQDIHKVMATAVYTQGDNQTFIIKRGVGFNRLTTQLKSAQLDF